MRILMLSLSFICNAVIAHCITLPSWFTKSFIRQGLNNQYRIIQTGNPIFLEADFNGDNKPDIAVQIIDIRTNKKGILIINSGHDAAYIFGAGKKFSHENLNNTSWLNGWKVYRDKVAYKSRVNSDGDIIEGEKVKLKYPAIYIYSREDGEDVAGELIYCDRGKYISIHQGE